MNPVPQIFAVVGPSGAGKDTLIRGAIARRPELRLVRRVITRPSEAGGEDYEGVSEAEFADRLARGAFALDWAAHGLRYGIPRDALSGSGVILFNGSRAVLPLAARLLPGLRVILVTAPDHILAARLSARGRESLADIQARLSRAAFAMPEGVPSETVINDGTLERGVTRFLAALQPVSA